jgi:hypothetical protein
MKNIIRTADLKDIFSEWNPFEISTSKFAQLINEKANQAIEGKFCEWVYLKDERPPTTGVYYWKQKFSGGRANFWAETEEGFDVEEIGQTIKPDHFMWLRE